MSRYNNYDVVLEKVGNQPLKTTKILCQVLGLGLAAAKAMVDKAPTTVATGIDRDKALALAKELETIGNTVSIPGMETKTEAIATKKTTTTKKQTTKKSAPSSSKVTTPSNDDFDAIFGGDTAQKTTKTTKAKAAPKATTKKATAASDEAFDEIFGDSTPKAETKSKAKKSESKVVDKQAVVGEYFAELSQLRQGIKETGTYSGDGDMKPEIALAVYGDMDAVFSSFKRETLSGYMRIARSDLEKQYKKLNKKIEKMKKASRYDKAKKCFSDDDRLVPCVSYELAMLNLRAGMPDSYINMMTTTALDGDPRAITYCQDYFSTNSEKANPYSVAIEKHNIRLNGKFDFYEMFFYAIRGIGFDYSPYYPDSEIAIPGWEFGRVNIEIRRTEALKKLYQTLAYFVIPENSGTAEYKEHFGDFMPSELQIKIARHWFFIEDDRLVMSDETKKLRDELRTKITDAICGAPQKSAKANDQKAPAASAVSAETESAPKAKFERVEYDNGSYEGEIVDGLRHGKGKYTWSNGSEYEGDWVKGKRCGFGVYKSYSKNEKDGSTYTSYTYEGEWKDSKQHGHGVAKGYKAFPVFGHVYMNWSYEGPWVDDKKHGRGVYREWDGNANYEHWKVYEGEWIDDKRHGLFVWRPEPAAKDLKYIDYYEHGKEVVGYIDYDPSIKTLEDARRAKETEREDNQRVMDERRAREAAQSRTVSEPTTTQRRSSSENFEYVEDLIEKLKNPALFNNPADRSISKSNYHFGPFIDRIKDEFDGSDYATATELFANILGLDSNGLMDELCEKLGNIGNHDFGTYIDTCLNYAHWHVNADTMIPFANLCYYCGNYLEDNFMSHYTSAHIRHSVTSDCDILYFERYANGNPFEPLSEEDDFLGHEAECGEELDEMLNNGYFMGSDCRLYLPENAESYELTAIDEEYQMEQILSNVYKIGEWSEYYSNEWEHGSFAEDTYMAWLENEDAHSFLLGRNGATKTTGFEKGNYSKRRVALIPMRRYIENAFSANKQLRANVSPSQRAQFELRLNNIVEEARMYLKAGHIAWAMDSFGDAFDYGYEPEKLAEICYDAVCDVLGENEDHWEFDDPYVEIMKIAAVCDPESYAYYFSNISKLFGAYSHKYIYEVLTGEEYPG